MTKEGSRAPRVGRPRKIRTPEEEALRREKERERLRKYRQRKREEAAAAGKQSANAPEVAPIDEKDLRHIKRYINFLEGTLRKQNSLIAYENDLCGFARHLEGKSLMEAVRDDVTDWIRNNTRDPKDPGDPRPWSQRTARRKLSALSGFYMWAIDEKLIEHDPTHRISLRKSSKEEQPVRLSKEDVRRMFECIETKILVSEGRQALLYILDAAIMSLMYHFGLRVSEATNLSRSNIHYREGRWYLKVVRKGDQEGFFPLTGVPANCLKRWEHVRAEIEPARPEFNNLLFLHPWTGWRLSRKRAWIRIRRIAREAGLDPKLVKILSPHKLRHAIAFHMLEAGETIAAVQALLGHMDISTTGIYVRQNEEQRLATLKRSSEILKE